VTVVTPAISGKVTTLMLVGRMFLAEYLEPEGYQTRWPGFVTKDPDFPASHLLST
jgi:hypothetical protein